MNSKFAIRDIFYFGGLMLLTISSSLVGRTYLFLVPHLNPALKYGSIVLFFLSLFYKNWRKNVLIKSLALIAVILIVSIITDANILFIYVLAIVSSKPEDFDKICRFLFWANLILFFTTISLYEIGILQDEIIIENGISAHSLGYAHYSSPAYSIFFLTVLGYYLYSGTKYSYKRLIFYIISAVSNCLIYKLTTVRLVFYLYLGMMLLIITYDYLEFIRKVKINKIAGTIMFPIMFFLSISLPFIYLKNSILIKLNSLLNNRFYFGKMGFDRYNVNLFGNKIITNAGGFDENWHNTYFYIDSGYVYLLLGYGLIICTIVLFVYIMCSRYAAEHKNSKLFIWCILICVFAFVNNPLIDIILNALLFVIVPMFHAMRKERKLRQIVHKKNLCNAL